MERWRMSYEGQWAEMVSRPDGEYVLYADAKAAIREAEWRGYRAALSVERAGDDR